MIYCKDCKHFNPSNFCVHPKNGVNLVTGNYKPFFATACRRTYIINDHCNGCGLEGKLWQSESNPVKPWYKFWR